MSEALELCCQKLQSKLGQKIKVYKHIKYNKRKTYTNRYVKRWQMIKHT